jgi:hypothetical protein
MPDDGRIRKIARFAAESEAMVKLARTQESKDVWRGLAAGFTAFGIHPIRPESYYGADPGGRLPHRSGTQPPLGCV